MGNISTFVVEFSNNEMFLFHTSKGAKSLIKLLAKMFWVNIAPGNTLCALRLKMKSFIQNISGQKKASSVEFSKMLLPSGFEAKLTIYEKSWQNIKIWNNTVAKECQFFTFCKMIGLSLQRHRQVVKEYMYIYKKICLVLNCTRLFEPCEKCLA